MVPRCLLRGVPRDGGAAGGCRGPAVAPAPTATPLALASANGNARIIERLLKAGVDANSMSEDGETALMTAARNGKTDAVRVLIRHGANVNATELFKGQTPLMFAAGTATVHAPE